MTQGTDTYALRRPRGVGWGGSWGSFKTEGPHVYPCLIRIVVWQKTTQHCKAVILQLKINKLKKQYFLILKNIYTA